MITKTEIRPVITNDKPGYCFDVYYNNAEYPNLISAPFKTKIGTQRKLNHYIKTGKFDFYGNAE